MTRGFKDWRLPKGEFGRVLSGTDSVSSARLATRLQVAARLHHRAAGSYPSLQAVIPDVHDAGRSAPGVRDAVFDAMIESVDARLQTLYDRHLGALPLGGPRWVRLAESDVVFNDACDVVKAYDWRWLADWLALDGTHGERWCLQRLSNRAFPCSRVNFRFTYHCNIACRHCYNESGPQRKTDRLPLESMLEIVREMPGVGIPALNLTGGEPMLDQPTVCAVVREARKVGIDAVTIYTNGFWGRSELDADRTLAGLQDAGFGSGSGDGIKVSTGIYHQEFLSVEVVRNIARQYLCRFGRPLSVDIEAELGAAEEASQLASWIGVPVRMSVRRVSAVGRGREVAVEGGSGGQHPCRILDQIVFEPNGDARPCCGLNATNAGVRIGVLGQVTLRGLVKRIQNDPLLQSLASSPLKQLFALRGRPTPSVGRDCELCQAAIGDLDDREPLLRQLEPQQRYYPFWFADGCR